MVLEDWTFEAAQKVLMTSPRFSTLTEVTDLVSNIQLGRDGSSSEAAAVASAASLAVPVTERVVVVNMVTSTSPAASHMSNEDSPYGGHPGYEYLDESSSTSQPGIKKEPLDASCSSTSNSPTARSKNKKSNSAVTAGRSIEEEVCLICGDRASGYHYNALSCEGCKGFFRRSITKGSVYTCKNGGNCEMDMWMRRRCQFCRLKRCREVGMKEECLLSDDQCKARDARRKSRVKKISTVREEQLSPDSNLSQPETRPPTAHDDSLNPEDVLSKLLPAEVELITKLVQFQDQFELPNEDDIQMMKQVKVKALGKLEMSDTIFEQMAGMTVLVTHLIVEYAKHLPGFQDVTKDDQIALLKGAACDIMMIRTARRYDKITDTIVFADGERYTKENLKFAGLSDYVEAMFCFCRGMANISTDNAEYALLTAICLMCDRPWVIERKQIEDIQYQYVSVLQNYVRIRRGPVSNHFAKLLMKLTELRTLSAQYETVLMNIQVQRGPLPPLLKEFFDVS